MKKLYLKLVNFIRRLTGMNLSLAIQRQAFAKNPVSWFGQYGRIKSKKVADASSEDRKTAPKPNLFQLRVGEAVEWCLATRRPVKIVIVKPRQKGSSTVSTEIVYVLSRINSINIMIVGGKAFQAESLWGTLKLFHQGDEFDKAGGWGNTFDFNQKICRVSNGSEILHATAGTDNVGMSKTLHFCIITEIAHWPESGAKAASDALHSLLGCVPKNEPGTGVIMESTGNGPAGMFPDTWNGAVTLEEAKAGKKGNGYLRVSALWWEFEDSVAPLTQNEARNFRQTLQDSGDKKALLVWDRFPHLTPYQMAFYHQMLVDPEVNGDEVKRDRHYPSSIEDSFSSSNPSRFSSEGLDTLERRALACEREGGIIYGRLEKPEGQRRPSFIPCDKREAEFMMLADGEPVIGQTFNISIDNMTGESHALGADPDTNSALVNRGGYLHQNVWYPFEPVMSTMPLNRWDYDVLAAQVALMSQYYGNCLTIPERNRGEALIKELRKLNVPLRQTPRKADEAEQGKPTGFYGWQTDKSSKPVLTTNLANLIRSPSTEGGGIAIRFMHIIKQLRTFVRHPDGHEGGIEIVGVYDDAVMSLGIGALFRNEGTVYQHPDAHLPPPRDIALLEGSLRNQAKRPEVW